MKNVEKNSVFAIGKAEDAELLIGKLLAGTILAVEVRNFLSEKECDHVVGLLHSMEMDEDYLQGKARKIGLSAHNMQSGPDAYFQGAKDHPLLQHPTITNVVDKFFELFRGCGCEIGVATNRSGDDYSATIVREFHSELKIHNDFAPREQVGWFPIQDVRRQFAYVLKLTNCLGGETLFYPKRWEASDEAYFNHDDNYSYDKAVVSGFPEFRINGPKGTLIVFDCTNYHSVNKVLCGRRYTMGGFVGELSDEQFIVWS
ncbi:2OG-Fe(II) oxygenase [Dyadobacter bucti]|uniref:2OG-Fe(II) oxygenase n=1 Tax=Dyadobacter bucti TaxID=2572203 RepID=UPI0011083E9E|nr:2OG-Fe(II) oxygenase [Dyadobacter bucti]